MAQHQMSSVARWRQRTNGLLAWRGWLLTTVYQLKNRLQKSGAPSDLPVVLLAVEAIPLLINITINNH